MERHHLPQVAGDPEDDEYISYLRGAMRPFDRFRFGPRSDCSTHALSFRFLAAPSSRPGVDPASSISYDADGARAHAFVNILWPSPVRSQPLGLPPRERALRDQREGSSEQQQGNVDAEDRPAERLRRLSDPAATPRSADAGIVV